MKNLPHVLNHLPAAIAMSLIFADPGAGVEPEHASPSPAPAHIPRIATVDMQVLFKQYHRTAEVEKQLGVDRARIQKEGNERLARITELGETLDQLRKQLDDPSVSESRKQSLFKDWQTQQQEAISLDRERREFLQRKTQALNEHMVRQMKVILGEIRTIVEEQAKLGNYDHVFDRSGSSASQVPILVYTKDSTDITPALLRILDRDAPAENSEKKTESGNALKAGEDR